MSGAEGAILLSILEVIKTIKEIIILINGRNKNSAIQIETKENLDRKSRLVIRRHTLFCNEVFYPLYRNIITIDSPSYNLISYVNFTGSDISKSLHYKEALEHLNQNLPGFSIKLNELQHLINMFNSDLRDFQEQRLLQLVSDHLIQNGFSVFDNYYGDPQIGTINVQYVLEALKNYWKDNKDILYIMRDTELRIPVNMGHALITIIKDQSEADRVKEIINQLKDLDKIKIEFNKFLDEYRQIDYQSRHLSEEIGNKVIRLIQLGEYDDACKLCRGKTYS